MRVRAAVASLLGVGLAASGCTAARTSYFAALTTERVPSLGYKIEDTTRVSDVAAEVVTHTILWIPTNTRPPTLGDAVHAALERGNGGNLLVNASVEHWWVFVPLLYGQEGWRVRGDVVRTVEPDSLPTAAAADTPASR